MHCRVWLLIPFLLFGPVRAEAQTPRVEISGFGDVYSAAPLDSAGTSFALGQAEVDVYATLTHNISASAALAYDGAAGAFGPGEFFVEFRLFGAEENHLRPSRGVTHCGIMAGQFDVPFGIDWEVYASIDRKLVTPPLVVENAHGLWNDTGVQGHAANDYFSGVLFAVNGFGYDDVRMRYAAGGRFGIKPLSFLEIGGSYAGFVRPGGNLGMDLTGGDARIGWRGLHLKGEYITRKTGFTAVETTDFGYYAEGIFQFGRFFGAARYDSYNPSDAEEITRTSFGGGWVITDGCELRFEYQLRPDEEEDVTFLQVAAGF
ncbi:MAG: hypothetical protein ACYC9O_00885 [Candidatus Latescibacterota bacterium]